MPEAMDNKKAKEHKKAAPQQADKAAKDKAQSINPRHKIGLVEIIMILLLAGVVFIFIFGMNQMKAEKARELELQQMVGEVLPTFGLIANEAKVYKENDPFGAWPLTIEELNLPAGLDTPQFKFSFSDAGAVIMTTTKDFGKKGITVSYDITKDIYDINDPDPTAKPVIKEDWLNQ
ncbi:MAG: hypothetical protein K0B87_07930 [Candidatus Syntrophosphaera sp.]|nr:hypothetical protein [Candidatus Syntrophosphaera sp.]